MSIDEKVRGFGRGVGRRLNPLSKMSYKPIDDHLEEIFQYDSVKSLLNDADESDQDYMKGRLIYHLDSVRKESRRLKYFGGFADSLDMALIPFDAVSDAGILMGGAGIPGNIAKESIEMPVKIGNSLYYAFKTGDYLAPVTDLGYEVASMIVPASVLDITDRYTNRVDDYVLKEAARRFEKEMNSRRIGRKSKLVNIAEEFHA